MTYADRSIRAFLEEVASPAVVPGGGSVAAVCGGAGAALCEMACIHTVEREDYTDVTEELAGIREDLRTRRDRLLELADEDAAAADAVKEAFQTPQEDGRDRTIGEASERATEVPLETATACLAVLEGATVVVKKGNRNTVPDAVTGALLAHAALEASVRTARSNQEYLTDDAFVVAVEGRSTELERDASEALRAVRANAAERGSD